jgi:hypothetical protein
MNFHKIESQPLLAGISKPSRYLDHEINAFRKQPEPDFLNFCLAFPDVYEVGVAHLG